MVFDQVGGQRLRLRGSTTHHQLVSVVLAERPETADVGGTHRTILFVNVDGVTATSQQPGPNGRIHTSRFAMGEETNLRVFVSQLSGDLIGAVL